MTPIATVLGRLAAPPSAAPWEQIRLDLLDALVRAKAGEAPPPAAWTDAWQIAATELRDQVLDDAVAALNAAARHSRYPAKRLALLLPDSEQADILLQRLLAEAITLEGLAAAGESAEVNRARGTAIETAWEGAARIATSERLRWRAAANRVAEWRRPWRPVVIAGSVLSLAAVIVASWLGGQLPAPQWFDPVAAWFWELPWP
ncbi:MAG: hypothetical protein SFU57_04120 [Gemmatimonadales bacterium]|nr:hypothetical protein [Gemmatimonadales bacterium]